MNERSVAVILGSAFAGGVPEDLSLSELQITTPWGEHPVHRVEGLERPAYLLFRHGLPHRLLPHQIPYRAQAWALRAVRCGALLVTSSVGVLDRNVPL
jgi:5'-methylthioadenosine phosphorylase